MYEDTEDRESDLYEDTRVGDNDQLSEWPSFDDQIPHQRQNLSACECGNEESELFAKEFDANGNSVISVRCWNCDRERKPWTSEANHSFVVCSACGDNTEDLYEKTINRSGQLVGVFCRKCETLIAVNESTRPTQRISSSESQEPPSYLCNDYETCECDKYGNSSEDLYEKTIDRSGQLVGIFCRKCETLITIKESTRPIQPISSESHEPTLNLFNSKTGECPELDESIAPDENQPFEPLYFDSYRKPKMTSLNGDSDAWKRCGGIYNRDGDIFSQNGVVVGALSDNEQNVIHKTVAGERTGECREPGERFARVANLPGELPPAVSYKKTKVASLETLKRGDHIAWKRCRGIYYHHAIVVEVLSEKELNVIHNTVAEDRQSTKRGAKCMILMGNKGADPSKGDLYLCNYKPGESLEPNDVIYLAEGLLDSKVYNLFLSNCEHFATFCKTAKPFSNQVASFISVGTILIGQLMIPVPIVGLLIGRTIGDILKHFIEEKAVISCLKALMSKLYAKNKKRQGIHISSPLYREISKFQA